MALLLASCGGASTDATGLTFYVATQNLQDRDETFDATHRRMRDLGRGLAAAVPTWSLVGVQESRYVNDWTGIPEVSTAYSEAEPFPCPPAGEVITGAACYAKYLGTTLVTTHRSNGVMAQENWEFVTAIETELEEPDDIPAGALIRSMHGQRIRHTATGVVIPFYSVHTVPGEGADYRERQRLEITNMISAIRDAWQPGDLPPVVVGDFNCGPWRAGVREILYRDFYEASGQNSIDLVFVGRPDRWLDAGGVILPAETDETDLPLSGRYLAKDQGLSDHNATWVLLEWDTSRGPTDVTLPPYQDAGGEGCRPT